jgi:hypothetical protein
MLDKIQEFIGSQDIFCYNPYAAIGFKKNKTFSTLPGGIASILLAVAFYFLWGLNFYQMFTYSQNTVLKN